MCRGGCRDCEYTEDAFEITGSSVNDLEDLPLSRWSVGPPHGHLRWDFQVWIAPVRSPVHPWGAATATESEEACHDDC